MFNDVAALFDMWKIQCETVNMRIGFAYNRPPSDFKDHGVDELFIGMPGEGFDERDAAIKACFEGYTLVLFSMGDLGKGAEIKAMVAALKDRGVEIEVIEQPPLRRGARSWFVPTTEQQKKLQGWWLDPTVHMTTISWQVFASQKKMIDLPDTDKNRERLRQWCHNKFGKRTGKLKPKK